MFLHFIKKGDTISSLSKEYEVPSSKIIFDNGLIHPNKLSIGECLIINKDSFIYKSKKGDTFNSIAKKYKLNIEKLINDNKNLSEPLKENTPVNIIYFESDKREIEVNGYTYPSIKDEQLDMVLPYLTYISIFSHKVYEDGSIDNLDDERIIKLANEYDVLPIFVVSNIKEKGGFSPSLASKILNNENLTTNFLNNILRKVKEKNYKGVNIDFEYVKEDDKDVYEAFMKKAYSFFKNQRYYFTTSLAPKVSKNQEGLLYTAHNYEVAGKNNDLIILMTYEWGYTYSESMPVSPLNKVESVLKYAVSEIQSNKILMGIPNYGYDYTLPYEKGKAAKSLTLDDARELAFNNNAEIKYYKEAETPYFKYKKDDVLHEVQYDNAYSFYKKLELIDEYNLGGISIWTLKTHNQTYYTLLSHYFDIKKISR